MGNRKNYLKSEKSKRNGTINSHFSITNTEENEHLLVLPYNGKVGETRLKS